MPVYSRILKTGCWHTPKTKYRDGDISQCFQELIVSMSDLHRFSRRLRVASLGDSDSSNGRYSRSHRCDHTLRCSVHSRPQL